MAGAEDGLRQQLLTDLQARLATGDDLGSLSWPLKRLHARRDEQLRALVAHAPPGAR